MKVSKKLVAVIYVLIMVVTVGFTFSFTVTAVHRPSMVPLGTKVSVRASSDLLWILPGKRELDPEVFGTPDAPKMVHKLPIRARNVSEEGNTFTTTKAPTPFSNKVAEVQGKISIEVDDRSPLDAPDSLDKASLTASFTGPEGINEYRVELEKVIPVGPDHQFFGGVGTDVYMHGSTGIGEPLMPAVWSYVTLWGYGKIYMNGELVGDKRLIHSMVTPKVRNEEDELTFEQSDILRELNVHLILPPTRIVDGKPTNSPVPTGYTLPNGNKQPFLHVNFYEVSIHGSRFLPDKISL